MKVFLDTNIILDFYDSSRGHYMPSAIIFDLALKQKLDIYICAQSFITAFYILRKVYDKDELYRSMRALYSLCKVTSVDASIIEKALDQEGRDFEDTCQYYSFECSDADIILTRDRKGFEDFDVRHISAEEFLEEFFNKEEDSQPNN